MIVGCLSLVAAFAQGQTLPTWVDDIAPIVHTHCAHCHHNGGAGPFPLVTYEDVFFTANVDVHVIQDGEMPPWPAGTYVMQVGGIDKRASRTWIKQ